MKFLVPVARSKPGGLPADGRDLRPASLRYAEAGQLYAAWRHGSPAIRKRILDAARAVFQNAAASGSESSRRGRRRTVARSGDGGGDCEPRASATGRARRPRNWMRQQREAARQQIEHIATATPPHRRRTPTGASNPMLSQAQRTTILELTRAGSEQTRDRAGAGDLPRGGAQSPALELHRSAGTAACRESRTLPATDPGAFRPLQGESRASP